MPPKNQGYIDSCLVTEFIRCNAPVQPRALGKGAIIGVIVQNTFNLMTGVANASEVMVGTASGQPYQMTPGQESPIIYADDLEDIWIRVRDTDAIGTPGTPVDVTVIVYKERNR
jgi:hypothetical protein